MVITTFHELEEVLEDIDEADFWNDVEEEEWRAACEFAGLNFDEYEYPEELFEDLCSAANVMEEDMVAREAM